jgi:tRNA pseudouridine32 synthase / 23S rRNA pseudouridine746 synthase
MSTRPCSSPGDAQLRVIASAPGWLAIDKPAGLPSVPGRKPELADCAIARVQRRFPEALVVHRLDMATSGLLLLARSAAAQRSLSRAFEQRRVHKTYEAWVAGQVMPEEGLIDAPLAADWPARPRQRVCQETGRPSQTRFRVLERRDGASRLRLEPLTGRSHQLRVHLLHIGHPILGDGLYGPGAEPDAQRLMLHASGLAFADPDSGEPAVLVSPVPF